MLAKLKQKLNDVKKLHQSNVELLQQPKVFKLDFDAKLAPNSPKSSTLLTESSPLSVVYDKDINAKEGIRYLTAKYTLLCTLAEEFRISKADRIRTGINDEDKIFISNKILLEELKQSAAQVSDTIIAKRLSIEVSDTF